MAKYLDQTGLQSVLSKLKNWAEGKFLTEHQDISGKVDKVSGKGLSTNDFTTTLKNKLDGIATGAEVNVNADWNATSGDAQILNKPTIPTNNNQLTNGAGYQTASQVSTAISNAIKDITSFEYEVVTSLPATGVKGKIYLVAHAHGTGDAYDEYIWTGSAFEKIGNTDIDLSDYVQKDAQNIELISFVLTASNTYTFHPFKSLTKSYTYADVLAMASSKYVIFCDTSDTFFALESASSTSITATCVDFEDVSLGKMTFMADGNHTYDFNNLAAKSHAHGNITIGGALQSTDISIANGDKLVVTDASNSNKVARTSVAFDGSTATKALTQKGTFETFLTSHQSLAGYVPTTRKVNNKALSSDITLSASDVSAVPTTRKVNNKALSSDITLSASDVGAAPSTVLDNLDFTDPTAAATTSTTFIDSISQTDGLISATKKTLPTASTTVAGITKVGASGGAAAYSHSHSYTNDSALGATEIAAAFAGAGYPA